MSQSSIEWFFKWVNDNYEATNLEFQSAFQQAKEMHKEEVEDAYGEGKADGIHKNDVMYQDSIDYYNKTFNK